MKSICEPEINEEGIKIWRDEKGMVCKRQDGDGFTSYWNGIVRHREDGPAIEWDYLNYKEWWYNGHHIKCNTQEEFEALLKLELFW